jgi:hypothetical protein
VLVFSFHPKIRKHVLVKVPHSWEIILPHCSSPVCTVYQQHQTQAAAAARVVCLALHKSMPGIRVHEYSHFSDGEVAAGDRLWPISCVQSDTVYNHKLCWRAHKVILLVPASCHVLHIHTYICIYTYMCIHTYISTHLCILGAKIWQCFYQVIKPSLSEVHHLQDIHYMLYEYVTYIYTHTSTVQSKWLPHILHRWMAPESIQFRLYSQKSDVYAFGTLLWEMWSSGSHPFMLVTDDEEVARRSVLPTSLLWQCCMGHSNGHG